MGGKLTQQNMTGGRYRHVHVCVCTCLSGERRHLPCINFKDSARPYSICLDRRTSRVRVPPEAALLFLWGKKELSLGVVACICLVSITDYSCTCT